jgi:hypothetical protein
VKDTIWDINTFVSKTLYILCIKVKIRTAFLYNNSPLPVISEGWHLTHSGKHLHGRIISLIGETWVHKYSHLLLKFLYQARKVSSYMYVMCVRFTHWHDILTSSQESERLCMRVRFTYWHDILTQQRKHHEMSYMGQHLYIKSERGIIVTQNKSGSILLMHCLLYRNILLMKLNRDVLSANLFLMSRFRRLWWYFKLEEYSS